MSTISDHGANALTLIGHALPFAVLAAIVVLVIARRLRIGLGLPTFAWPRRPRRKRSPSLRLVKATAMDRQLAELLRSERERDDRS